MTNVRSNPVPTIDDVCEVCGMPYAHLHEVFFGTGQRQKSIEYGMQVRLCQWHHQGPTGPHTNRERDLELKTRFQKMFESVYGHEKFMTVFGRNYL